MQSVCSCTLVYVIIFFSFYKKSSLKKWLIPTANKKRALTQLFMNGRIEKKRPNCILIHDRELTPRYCSPIFATLVLQRQLQGFMVQKLNCLNIRNNNLVTFRPLSGARGQKTHIA